jgi:uncharacterized metal-binding protein
MDPVIFQYIGAGLGMSSVAVLSIFPKYIVESLGVHVFSCVGMGLYAFLTDQPGIYVSQMVYILFDLVGIVMWTKHKRAIDILTKEV